jgi:hypothetical protein
MVAPLNTSKAPNAKAPAAGKTAPKGGTPKKAAPVMEKDQAKFGARPDESIDLATVKQGALELKGNVRRRVDTQGESTVTQAEFSGKLDTAMPTDFKLRYDAKAGTSLDANVQATDTLKLSAGVSEKAGKAKAKAKVEYKDKKVSLSGEVDTDRTVTAKAGLKVDKDLDLSIEGRYEAPKKAFEGKARVKAKQTTVDVGFDNKKLLSGSVMQQLDSNFSVGLSAKATGEMSARARYEKDAFSVTADVGQKQSIEVGYKKNNLEVSGFAKSDNSYGIKFGYSTKF